MGKACHFPFRSAWAKSLPPPPPPPPQIKKTRPSPLSRLCLCACVTHRQILFARQTASVQTKRRNPCLLLLPSEIKPDDFRGVMIRRAFRPCLWNEFFQRSPSTSPPPVVQPVLCGQERKSTVATVHWAKSPVVRKGPLSQVQTFSTVCFRFVSILHFWDWKRDL